MRAGIIHKDIRPRTSWSIWIPVQLHLFGFGVASRVPRERPGAGRAAIAETGLAYVAPEQTGRINRSVDSRTDLYSAGVVLYQMLTVCCRFDARDPLEWVHAHLARSPVSPRERRPEIRGVSQVMDEAALEGFRRPVTRLPRSTG